MDEKKLKELFEILTYFSENTFSIEYISEQIDPNFIDSNGNNYLHYLATYTFKKYLSQNNIISKNEIINNQKYKFLLKQYHNNLLNYANYLNIIKFNFFSTNKFGQTPIELCLINHNYYLAKEYIRFQQSISYLFETNIIDKIIINGYFLEEDCIDFITYLFNYGNKNILEKEIIKKYLKKPLNEESKFTPFTFIFGEYYKNIYNKYNYYLKINCIDYLYKKDNEEYAILPDEQTKNKIKNNSISDLNNFCMTSFYSLINVFYELGDDIYFLENKNEKKNISLFMNLMAYPKMKSLSEFINKNNININYQDYYGRTPLIHLINNKNNITNISEDVYNDAFNILINYDSIHLSKRDKNGISAFLLCLINEYYNEAKLIYNKYIDKFLFQFNLDIILLLIIKMNQNNFNEKFIENLLNIFTNKINFDLIDKINNRTLLHYFFMFYPDYTFFDVYTNLLNYLMKLKIDKNKKDIYNRNCLFYLLIDFCGDTKIIEDPYRILEYCLKNKLFEIDLNENDIFGNNLIFYSIKGGFKESLKILLKYGAELNDSINNDGNTIYSSSLIVNEELFLYLYDIKKDPNIFEHKVFYNFNNYEYYINSSKKKVINKNGKYKKNLTLSMFDFFNNPKLILKSNHKIKKKANKKRIKINIINNKNNIKINHINKKNNNKNTIDNNINNKIINNFNKNNNEINNIINNINKNIDILCEHNELNINNKNDDKPNKISTNINNNNDSYDIDENKFSIFSLQNEKINKIINNYINENFNFQFENPLKEIILKIENKNILNIINILENPHEMINLIKNRSKIIISDNLFKYCFNKNKINIYKFIEERENKISLCKNLIQINSLEDTILYLDKIIDENKNEKLINIKNKEGQNIFHILAMIQISNNEQFQSIYDKISLYKIDNLYDSDGNTPMYYACLNLNKKFIEFFSNNNIKEKNDLKLNTSLFVETRNDTTPLEQLYKHLNLMDDYLLSLIIQITLKEKKGYLIHILKYLIDNYKPSLKEIFEQSYNNNISKSNYINRVIGLFQYLVYELGINILIKDNEGNDAFILSVLKNKFDFFFDILIPEKNKNKLIMNTTNKEGKTVVHLIVESKKIKNKKKLLSYILDNGFYFNTKDNKGYFPLEYAYFNHENEIIDILKKKYYKEGLPIKKNITFNFYKDSDILFKESILDFSRFQQSENLFELVYNEFKYHGDGIHKVCVDNESYLYNAVLIRGNILYFELLNNKLVIQIIENTENKNFIVITFEKKKVFEYKYNNFNEAENKFKELFKKKTNNDWDIIKKDKVKFKAKYYFFEFDYKQENYIYDYLKIAINNSFIKQDIKYNGNIKVRNLIYYLARKAYNNRFDNDNNNYIDNNFNSNKNIENDTRKIIIKYKQKGINNCISILRNLEDIYRIEENTKDFYKKKKIYLINSYLELVPFTIHNMDPNIFKSIPEIDEELGRVTTFYLIENILKIFLGAIKNLEQVHPLDYIINSLGCNIIELKGDSEEKNYIKDFCIKTGASSIKNIFKIKESNHDINFNPNNYKNRYIFFHGTKSENILGILSQGLKISPVQAEFSGKKFGNGIYLSDSFKLSLHYSKKKEIKNDKIFILLVEAALGDNNKDYKEYNINVDYKDIYLTDEGYGIFKFKDFNSLNKYHFLNGGIIVIKDEMNVRVKYIVEL